MHIDNLYKFFAIYVFEQNPFEDWGFQQKNEKLEI
jgi:hypothetical protein